MPDVAPEQPGLRLPLISASIAKLVAASSQLCAVALVKQAASFRLQIEEFGVFRLDADREYHRAGRHPRRS
jgi:hypothetical protein